MAVRNGAAPPLTVTLPQVVGGRNGHEKFRALIAELQLLAALIGESGERFGALIGASGPGYAIFMAIVQGQGEQGIGVGEVARMLSVSGAFVTTEAGKLVRLGLVEKRVNPEDRRGVLLRLSAEGRRRLATLLPAVQATNNHTFGALSAGDFQALCRLVGAVRRRLDEAVSRREPLPDRRAA
jgi:DNA-binding MarR family transcriptional regulator